MSFKNYLLPTPENDFAPHLLQKTAFLIMCGLVLLTFVTVNIQTVAWLSNTRLVAAVLPAVVFDTTNTKRVEAGMTPLRRSAVLDEAARLKAEHMAKHGYFAHYSPEGVSPWYWLNQVSYQYARAAENLAVHFNDSTEITEAWMESPSHRANILNQQYFEMGIGTAEVVYQGVKTVFVVQLLATKAAPLQPHTAPKEVPEIDVASVSLAEPALPLQEDNGGTEPDSPAVDLLRTDLAPAVMVSAVTTTALFPIGLEQFATLTPVAGSSAASFLATTPNTVLRIIYTVLGTFVATLLLSSVAVGMRYHRPWQTVYGVLLLLLMTGLFYLHSIFTTNAVVAASLL